MGKITTVGIDLAKNVFSVHAIDESGAVVFRKAITRARLMPTVAQWPVCSIGMEACSGAHDWARRFQALCHTVLRIMAARFVTPYRRNGKNDGNDSEAICEAMQRPAMRFVPVKSAEQQAVLSVHRVREGFVEERTAAINRIRGLLAEFGHNERFARQPRSSIDMHRPVRSDEVLDHIFVVKETRCVSKNLTLQYDKVLYMLQDTALASSLEGIYIDVFHYPDGRIEPRARGQALPFKMYDRLTEIDQGAIVDNKRLGKILEIVQLVQEKRDNRRSLCVTVEEGPPRKRGQPPGKKPQRALDRDDLNEAIRKTKENRTSERGRRGDISI